MAPILFDKMPAVRKLEGPFTRQQAATLSEVIDDAMSKGAATKEDIQLVRGDIQVARPETQALRTDLDGLDKRMTAEFSTVRAEAKAVFATVRAEIKAEIADAKVQMIVWVVGVMVTLMIASGLIQHFLH